MHIFKLILVSVSIAFVSTSANAVLLNGDFSSGLSNWETFGNVSESDGKVVMSTGAGTASYSASLIQGDDGSFSFGTRFLVESDINYLTFDFDFVTSVDVTETGSTSIGDYVDIQLYDYEDFSGGHDLFFSIDSLSAEAVFDVSSLAGREIALFLDLRDFNDGLNSIFTIDNILFSANLPTEGSGEGSVSIPEPNTILMFGGALLLLSLFNRKRFIPVKNNNQNLRSY